MTFYINMKSQPSRDFNNLIQSAVRQPLRILQEACVSTMSSKFHVPNPSGTNLKSCATRQKKADGLPSKLKDTGQNIKNKSSPLMNSRSTFYCKMPSKTVSNKRSTVADELKSKIPESTSNSVGSLASSPKWAHIKNKFENDSTSTKSKVNKKQEEGNCSKSKFDLGTKSLKGETNSKVNNEKSKVDSSNHKHLITKEKTKARFGAKTNQLTTSSSSSCSDTTSKKSTVTDRSLMKAKQNDKPFSKSKCMQNKSEIKSDQLKSLKQAESCAINATDSSASKANKLECPVSKSITSRSSSPKNVSANTEKIEELVKKSDGSSNKTVWVKDGSGNWVKKPVTDKLSKVTGQSKVAVLRSKFLENEKERNVPLTKSVTTSNVPCKTTTTRAECPLTKSNTTSYLLKDLTNKLPEVKSDSNSKNFKSTNKATNSLVKECNLNDKAMKSGGSSKKPTLNIVQRAVLSFEGNLALLSPESQRRLKLVSEKVQVQTDDDKILAAKAKSDLQSANNFKYNKKGISETKPANALQSKVSTRAELGEPVMPVRNFLSQYQSAYKPFTLKDKNDSKLEYKNSKSKITPAREETMTYGNITSQNQTANNETDHKSDASVSKGTRSDKYSSHMNKSGLYHGFHNATYINCKSEDQALQPNASFLWRYSDATSSELSKSSTTSSVSLTSSDFKTYSDIGNNHYSSLELEIEKSSETYDQYFYIDSHGSINSDNNNYASSSTMKQCQNMHPDSTSSTATSIFHGQNGMSDLKEDGFGILSSTLKKRKTKYSNRDYHLPQQPTNDTISFTDSSDTLINDEIENESVFDLNDSNHLYEPVYESLGNDLLSDGDDGNCSISLSPENEVKGEMLHSSLTSLESIESLKHDNRNQDKSQDKTATDTSGVNKKSGYKISQLKRHLSWTKNDIRFELSSKFNKIKIKKNFQNSTEIGVKVQETGPVNTSPKKKTFIKCILRQKSANNIPVKRSPSPRKENALFYVHLSMGGDKGKDSSTRVDISQSSKEKPSEMSTKQSDASACNADAKPDQKRPRLRKFSSSITVHRPKTPPPLPPTKIVQKQNSKESDIQESDHSEYSTKESRNGTLDSRIYAVLDPQFCNDSEDAYSENMLDSSSYAAIHLTKSERDGAFNGMGIVNSGGNTEHDSCSSNFSSPRRMSNVLSFSSQLPFKTENLKSPFEEEPMYQFYHKDAQQRATLWCMADGSESEFEDDIYSKSDVDTQALSKPPVLQSQMSAMDLIHGEGGQRSLWCEVPEVISSGILEKISPQDRKIQEAMFEVITSEASYLKSLSFLIEHFIQCPELNGEYAEKHILDKREKHILFSDVQPVRDVSVNLLADLEKRWLENIVLSNVCDIIHHHASKYFKVYVKYCSNQLYQERTLKELKDRRPEFVAILNRLESNPICQGLDMHSFLMLPMQRITRLPLLIDAIFHRLSIDSPIYKSCEMALITLNKFVAECNEGARKMERMEEMLVINQQLDFRECKVSGLLSASRWLVKKGELVQLVLSNPNRKTFGRNNRWCKVHLYLFLFTDLLVVTRKKSDDAYTVIDHCPRNMLQVIPVDENSHLVSVRFPSSYRNLFQMIMLNNRDGKTVEMLLSCLLESDRTRWMDAVTPAKSENPDEKIYEEWDCPQVQCMHAYNAQQPDELSLEEADVVNVFRKMADGWYEGERIRDGVRGWFPSSHTVEIINSHVKARNLHQRNLLLMLSKTYLDEQLKAQLTHSKK